MVEKADKVVVGDALKFLISTGTSCLWFSALFMISAVFYTYLVAFARENDEGFHLRPESREKKTELVMPSFPAANPVPVPQLPAVLPSKNPCVLREQWTKDATGSVVTMWLQCDEAVLLEKYIHVRPYAFPSPMARGQVSVAILAKATTCKSLCLGRRDADKKGVKRVKKGV